MNNSAVSQLFNSKLKENENILWSGAPRQKIFLRDVDMILVPISIIAIGFGLFFNFAIFYYQQFFFLPISISIVLAGFYIGILRFFIDSARRKKIWYCVTDKRILMLSKKNQSVFQTLPLKDIEQLDFSEEKDGSGFILFGNTNPIWPWLFGKFFFTRGTIPGFELVPEVQKVDLIIKEAIGNYVDPFVLDKVKPDARSLN